MLDFTIPALVAALPNLENLSLKNNAIVDVKVLSPLSIQENSTGFGCLKELLLEGNPLREDAIAAGNLEAYTTYALLQPCICAYLISFARRRELARRFPTISALDGIVIQPTVAPRPVAPPSSTPLGSGLKKPASYPFAMRPGLTVDSQDVVTAFLVKYVTFACSFCISTQTFQIFQSL